MNKLWNLLVRLVSPPPTDGKAVEALATSKEIELGAIPSPSKLEALHGYVDAADEDVATMSHKVLKYMRAQLHSVRLRDIITKMHYHGVYRLDDGDYRYVRNVLRINKDYITPADKSKLELLIARKEELLMCASQ